MAIYRDNSKRSQPLSAAGKKEDEKAAVPATAAAPAAAVAPMADAAPAQQELFPGAQAPKAASRAQFDHAQILGWRPRRLHHRRESTRTATPGEIFIKMAKEGSTLSGIMDAFALSVSISLQYGVPLRALVDKFVNSRFEPSGYTGNPEIRYAKSIVDYIGRWLGGKFISRGLSG